MGHCVTGLIAKHNFLASLAETWGVEPVISLNSDLALLPLTNDVLDAVFAPFPKMCVEGFEYLHGDMIDKLCKASLSGALIYFETEYFGGVGQQGATVFRAGEIVYGPHSAEIGPINEALGLVGIGSSDTGTDAFDCIGLGKYRNTDAWAESL